MNEKPSKNSSNIPSLKKQTSIILRVAGIIFFIANLMFVLEVLQVNFSTFAFIMDQGTELGMEQGVAAEGASPKGWNFFFLFSAILYTTSFLFALFSTGTASIYGGKNGFTQSVWNCQIYSTVTLALYTSLQILTGLEPEMQFILVTSILMQVIFAVIVLVCLKELTDFSWKDIRPKDQNSKLCIRVWLIMLVLIEVACFIWANNKLSI